MKILLPLYSYPNHYQPAAYIWDDVAEANKKVSITAIINPNNGPEGCPPNEDYQHGLDTLRQAGVTMIGYVYTLYGERDLNTAKAEVDLYNDCFDIDGIFFDEAATGADKLAYYRELYDYVKSKPNLDQVILNPGAPIDEGYLKDPPAGDIVVIFETFSDNWLPYEPPPYLKDYPADRFAVIIYAVPDICTLWSHINLALARNIGYVFLSDDTMPDPFDSLPTFWPAEIEYIASLNTGTTTNCFRLYLPLILKND